MYRELADDLNADLPLVDRNGQEYHMLLLAPEDLRMIVDALRLAQAEIDQGAW
jgi:hypothetical protein